MRRLAASFAVLLCALAAPSGSAATPARATIAQAAPSAASGTITAIGDSWFTIQTAGRQTGVVNALVASANAVTNGDYPYVWGGGHPEAGIASAIAGARGRSARVVGFDCSGAVAAVLSGAGLWPAGGPVPNDAGVVSQLLHDGLIARGPGSSPVQVTLYDHPGVHIFMNIDGRFFGTSDGGGGGSLKGGPGWLSDGAPDASNRAFKQYHVLPAVLKDRTSYGHTLTFQTGANPALIAGAALGDKVTVTYTPGAPGTMSATAVTYLGALTTSGTVTAIAPDSTSLTVQAADGSTLTFSANATLLEAVAVGDQIELTYTTGAAGLVARDVTVTASAAPASDPGTTAPGGPATPGAVPGTDGTAGGGGYDSGGGYGNGYAPGGGGYSGAG